MTAEKFRVLVVDDSPEDIAIIRRMLGRYRPTSFQVHAARSTDDCLKKLDSEGADLVLLDYLLPGEDGLAFLQRLAGAVDLPPVIMLTGQGDERLAVQSIRDGAYDYLPKDMLSTELLGRSAERALERFRQDEERCQFDEQIMLSLATAAEDKDPTTGGHLQRLARYAMLLGSTLRLNERQLRVLKWGGFLHDIGKLFVAGSILRKPGPLSEDEWAEVRQHSLIGQRLCGCLKLSRDVGAVIRHHHERWDGTGYPDGLAADAIPLLARAVSVVDAFDAMASDRPYRSALPIDEVLRRLAAGAGTQWDPQITRAFLDLVEREHIDEAIAARVERLRAA